MRRLIFAALVIAACSTRPALEPVALPDISSAAPAVQKQIRDQYAALQTTPDSFGAMGRLFLAAELYDAAGVCFRNAQTLQPADMRWPYYLAHVERLRNQPDKATALFERTLTLQPDHVPSLVWLGAMRLLAGDALAASSSLERALSLQPNDPAALYQAGRAALAQKNYKAAVERLTSALVVEPGASSIHYPLSLAYRGLGDTREADAQLRARGTTDPAPNDPLMREVSALLRNASAFEVRGAEALANRRWADAVTALRQAVALAPANAFTHLNLGTALFQTGDAGGALSEFTEAARLDPALAKAHYGAGIVREAAGHDDEAIAAFTRAAAADPSLLEAQLSLADALRRNGRDADAIAHYTVVINANPSASPAHFGLAMALVHARRYVEARDALARASTTFSDQPGFAHALARVLAAAPDDRARDGARALTITEGLLRSQRTVELAQTMAMALAEVGRFDEAVRWQSEASAAGGKRSDNLERYKQRLPCRVPWPENDPVFRPRPN